MRSFTFDAPAFIVLDICMKIIKLQTEATCPCMLLPNSLAAHLADAGCACSCSYQLLTVWVMYMLFIHCLFCWVDGWNFHGKYLIANNRMDFHGKYFGICKHLHECSTIVQILKTGKQQSHHSLQECCIKIICYYIYKSSLFCCLVSLNHYFP